MSLSSDQLGVLAGWLASIAVVMGFVGFVIGWAGTRLFDLAGDALRKRGAAAPFVQRAEEFERRARRWSAALERIAARNRREAIRRGDWVDDGCL